MTARFNRVDLRYRTLSRRGNKCRGSWFQPGGAARHGEVRR